jgi:septum site-determining protein MinC
MSNIGQAISTSPAFELKGSMLTMMVLQIFSTDNAALSSQLELKVSQAPAMFKQAPVILDLKAIAQSPHSLDIPFLVEILRGYGMLPIGVRGGDHRLNSLALGVGLNLLPEIKGNKAEAEPVKVDIVAEAMPAKIITQPVRSGQQIISKGDLIILNTVSPGAEILAQRHIHVYGALRGRALAGVNGDEQARIFCHAMYAELVSVAGNYQINEELEAPLLGYPVQIYFNDGELQIEKFGAIKNL